MEKGRIEAVFHVKFRRVEGEHDRGSGLNGKILRIPGAKTSLHTRSRKGCRFDSDLLQSEIDGYLLVLVV